VTLFSKNRTTTTPGWGNCLTTRRAVGSKAFVLSDQTSTLAEHDQYDIAPLITDESETVRCTSHHQKESFAKVWQGAGKGIFYQ
jgi:hypothetical protein